MGVGSCDLCVFILCCLSCNRINHAAITVFPGTSFNENKVHERSEQRLLELFHQVFSIFGTVHKAYFAHGIRMIVFLLEDS